jgi:TetR/AcrR family transcriptional regulator, cholesterol catabolism regulator
MQKRNGDGRSESGIERRRKAALAEGSEEYKERRKGLVAAAAAVFREKGYAAATLGDIAELLGTDRASIYYYVGGKEELFEETVREAVKRNLAEVDRIMDSDAAPERKLRLIVNMLISSYERHYPHIYVYIQEQMRKVAIEDSDWAIEMTACQRRFEAVTIGLVKECINNGTFRDDVRPDLAVYALYGMLNWTHRWFKPGGTLTAVEMADAFWTIFVEGMAPHARVSAPAHLSESGVGRPAMLPGRPVALPRRRAASPRRHAASLEGRRQRADARLAYSERLGE